MLRDMDLINYSHVDCEPLKNIMRLPQKEAYALAAELAAAHPDTTAFGRFADFHNYYPRRLETDRQLHAAFLALGGQPTEEHPLSFVLEGSDYLDGWFGHGLVTRIPLKHVPPEQVSFTLGDSMRADGFTLLSLDMLDKMMNDHPGGAEACLAELREKYHYIEVQLWDDGVLLP